MSIRARHGRRQLEPTALSPSRPRPPLPPSAHLAYRRQQFLHPDRQRDNFNQHHDGQMGHHHSDHGILVRTRSPPRFRALLTAGQHGITVATTDGFNHPSVNFIVNAAPPSHDFPHHPPRRQRPDPADRQTAWLSLATACAVRWRQLTTVFGSATQLTCHVPAGSITAGAHTVIVKPATASSQQRHPHGESSAHPHHISPTPVPPVTPVA